MNAKHLLQIPIVLTLLFGSVGTNQAVRADTLPPSISITITPTLLSVNESATATVSLSDVPASGYTSAEFSCTYPADRLQVSSIVVTGLFGPDPATAIYDQQDGSFVVGIAGSQDNRATAGGPAFTFQLKGLGTGQATVDCTARVSDGTNVLTGIGSAAAALTIMEPTATPTLEPLACDKAEFIADITVPPGTEMAPGTQFRKTWRLQNVGSCTWTTSYRLAFYGGEQMDAVSSVGFPISVAPGQMIDLSLDMIAPATPGSHHGYWIFQNDTGKPFGIGPLGNQAWLVRVMVSNATATPTPTGTISPSPESPTITPGGSTATPIPGMAYDFAENLCAAIWYSGAGRLPCPGTDGDPKGFALKLDYPRLETGAIDGRPGILTFPQNIQNGYIQGFYPPFAVQNGDRFRSTIGCEGGATSCYVAFRLDYQVGSDPIRTFWGPWLERYEGRPFSVDVDLSSLAGRNVKFILTVLSSGVATGDRALWASPILYRSGATPIVSATPDESPTPTPSPMPPPSATPTVQVNRSRYLNTRYWFEFYYPSEGQYANGTTDQHVRILLPFTPGTFLYEKYLDVTVAENPEICRSPLATSTTLDSVGMAFINGTAFLHESGHNRTAEQLDVWRAFSTYRDNVCVSFDLMMRAVNPDSLSTPLPYFDVEAEAFTLQQIVATFAWLTVPTATPQGFPTPTVTPTPAGSATPTLTLSPGMGTITGRVLSLERATVTLFAPDNWTVASILANPDGTFSLTVPAGNYTISADTYGVLSARGPVTVAGGSTTTKPTITLPAGDLDGDSAINQFDAMTIGMNYNSQYPEVADLNNDGIINVLDLEVLAKNYRRIGPIPWEG